MSWRTRNIKAIFSGISNSSDAVVWSPKRNYRKISLKSILTYGFFVPLFISLAGGSIISRKFTPKDDYPYTTKQEVMQDSQKIASIASVPQIELTQQITPSIDSIHVSYAAEKDTLNFYVPKNPEIDEKVIDVKPVIRADVLGKTGTTFSGTSILKYTKKGVKVPNNDYTIFAYGENYFPDSELFIQVPKEVLDKKEQEVCLTKINPDKLNKGVIEYLASFSTKIQVENNKDNDNFQEEIVFCGEDSPNEATKTSPANLENICTVENNNNNPSNSSLESVCKEEFPSNYSGNTIFISGSLSPNLSNYSPNLNFASIGNMDFTEIMGKYSRTGNRNLTNEVSMALRLGYKIGPVADSLKNKDGYMRSDSSLIENMETNGVYLSDTIVGLKKQLLSNKEIAKKVREMTKVCFEDGGGMNISEEQVSKILRKRGYYSRKFSKKHKEVFDTLQTDYSIYNNNTIITIKPGSLNSKYVDAKNK